jgi:hypothetical protein
MSTNNNRLGKEVQPIWLDGHVISTEGEEGGEDKRKHIPKLSGDKLRALISNNIEDLLLSHSAIDP